MHKSRVMLSSGILSITPILDVFEHRSTSSPEPAIHEGIKVSQLESDRLHPVLLR